MQAALLALSFGSDSDRMYTRAASVLLLRGGGAAALLLRVAGEAGYLGGDCAAVVQESGVSGCVSISLVVL